MTLIKKVDGTYVDNSRDRYDVGDGKKKKINIIAKAITGYPRYLKYFDNLVRSSVFIST